MDNLLNIDNIYFAQMAYSIYPAVFQLNKNNSSDTEVPFLGLYISIGTGIVSTKVYDKQGDFDIENVPCLDRYIPSVPLKVSHLL